MTTASVATLLEYFHYDDSLGRIVNKKARKFCPAGSITGAVRNDGYVRVVFSGRRYAEHRLVWLCVHGEWPKHTIDHIDGDKTNNHIGNLRDVTMGENIQNARAPLRNNLSSKLRGVTWHKQCQKWQAQIVSSGKSHHLGLFESAQQAQAAYLVAKQAMHPGSVL